jgi:hypothetical protein
MKAAESVSSEKMEHLTTIGIFGQTLQKIATYV